MRVVSLNRNPSMQQALEVVDALRKDVVEGRLIAFFVAGLDEKDTAFAYCSSVRDVSRLRLQGAMSQALHDMQQGTV